MNPMAATLDLLTGDLSPDPFLERMPERYSMDVHVLGGHFHFTSDSAALIDVVATAYAGLPAHALPVASPGFHVELRLAPAGAGPSTEDLPPARMQSGAGFLCGVMDANNYAVLFPEQRRALVVASADQLVRPYHLRYELIEIAVLTLATRALSLAPLHGACVGWHGRAALVMGSSGAGKSTLALHSLLRGMDFLSEDAVFVHPPSGKVTGVANYLHVQADALRFVDEQRLRDWIGQSPVIRRRSGVEKYEVDLRHGHGRLAPEPLELACVVFASARSADDPQALVQAIPDHQIEERLRAEQPYAASQPGWDAFVGAIRRRGAYELRRGRHPADSVDALMQLLG
jgi:hypothetical protein